MKVFYFLFTPPKKVYCCTVDDKMTRSPYYIMKMELFQTYFPFFRLPSFITILEKNSELCIIFAVLQPAVISVVCSL